MRFYEQNPMGDSERKSIMKLAMMILQLLLCLAELVLSIYKYKRVRMRSEGSPTRVCAGEEDTADFAV